MPLDPTLAAGVQPAQTPNPLATIGTLMQLKDYQAQASLRAIQAQQAQAQTADLQAQANSRNRDLADQNTLQAAMKDLDKAKKLLTGDTSPISGLVSPANEQKFKQAQQGIEEKQGTLDTTALTNRSTALKAFADTLTGLKQLGAEQGIGAANAALPGALNSLRAANAFQHVGADESKLPAGFQSTDEIDQLAAAVGAESALTDKVLAQKTSAAAAAKDAGQGAEAQANADRTTAMTALDTEKQRIANEQAERTLAGTSSAGMTAEQKAQADETARHNKASEATAVAELSVRRAEADPFGALGINPHAVANPGQGLTGDAYLRTLPAQLQPIIHQIATGQQAPISGVALTKPYGQQIMAAVAQYDPSFSADRANERKAFSSGKQGQNIQALNTATVHLDQLKDAAAALGNGAFVPGNQAYNAVAQTFGAAAPTSFEALKNVAAGELANAYKGSATDEEIKNISKTITGAQSPNQLAGTLSTQLHALAAKLNTYDEQYHQKIPNDTFSPVLPTARAVFEKNGIHPGAGAGSGSGDRHIIELNGKHYQYNGSGATDDLKNYSEMRR